MGGRSIDLVSDIDELEKRLIQTIISQQENQAANRKNISICECCMNDKNKYDRLSKGRFSSSRRLTQLKNLCGLLPKNGKRQMESQNKTWESGRKVNDKQKHSQIQERAICARQIIPCFAKFKTLETLKHQQYQRKHKLPRSNERCRTNRNLLNGYNPFIMKKGVMLHQPTVYRINRRQSDSFEHIIPKDIILLRTSGKGASARSRGPSKKQRSPNKLRARPTNKAPERNMDTKKKKKPSEERKGWSSPLDKVKSKIPIIGGKSSTENEVSNLTETEGGSDSTQQKTGMIKGVFSKLTQVPKPSDVKQMLGFGNKEEEESSKKEGGISKIFNKANILKSRPKDESSVSETRTEKNTDSYTVRSTETSNVREKSQGVSILKDRKSEKSKKDKGEGSQLKRKINIIGKAETLMKGKKSDTDTPETNKTSKSTKTELVPPEEEKPKSDRLELDEEINFKPIPDYLDLDKDFAIPDVDYCGISPFIQEDCATTKKRIKDKLFDPLCLHPCDYMCANMCHPGSHCFHDCTPCKGDFAYSRQQPVNVIVYQNPGPWMTPSLYPHQCHDCNSDYFSSLPCQSYVLPDPCVGPVSYYRYENCPFGYEPCFKDIGISVDEVDDVLDILNYS